MTESHPFNRTFPLQPATADTHGEAPDLLALLIADKRSPATRRAYQGDLAHFFRFRNEEPSREAVFAFLSRPRGEIVIALHKFKAGMIEQGLSEASVNRRLSAIRSLITLGHRVGVCEVSGTGLVEGEKVKSYRDVRGIGLPLLRRLLELPGTNTIRGKRDTALIRLMIELGARRAEVCRLVVRDADLGGLRVRVLGKGRGTQSEWLPLTRRAADCIREYLDASGHGSDLDGPLFRNTDPRPEVKGRGLTVNGLYYVIRRYGHELGLSNFSPHKIRHSSVTLALDLTGGDIRAVAQMSRHQDIRTVVKYDDARKDQAGAVVSRISDAL